MPYWECMTKADMIRKIAEKTGLKVSDTSKMYGAFVETLTEELVAGEGVQLAGIGSFLIRERAERTGRNPQTGEEITIPASKQVAFKVSKTLKDAINS